MSLVIDPRFRGPEGSGNGGFVAGLLAARAGALPGGSAAVVTLRLPPPLGAPLAVVADGDGEVRLLHGDALVAEASRSRIEVEPVPPVTLAEAEAAEAAYEGRHTHPFPGCFVCGPDREPGDGMRLAPGRLPDGRTACTWTVPPDLAGRPELVWAALDCPGGWAGDIVGRPSVLGRLTAQVRAVPAAGDVCVVTGRLLGTEGRKTWTASTLWGPGGDAPGGTAGWTELGRAHATWIALPAAPSR